MIVFCDSTIPTFDNGDTDTVVYASVRDDTEFNREEVVYCHLVGYGRLKIGVSFVIMKGSFQTRGRPHPQNPALSQFRSNLRRCHEGFLSFF